MRDDACEARLLEALELLLAGASENLALALRHASDVVAEALHADKVDAFLYDEARDCLVAVGSSAQPLSEKQKKHGLDVLQVSNGGRVVSVFETGETFWSGRLDEDADELRGVKETLGIKSQLGVPLRVGREMRGMLMIASLQPDFFTPEDVRFAETFGRWIGLVAHRAELVEEISKKAAADGRRAGAEELITVVAHELRNAIAPLEIRLTSLEQRALREGRERDVVDLRKANKGLSRMIELVGEILDVSRLEHGLFQLETRVLDVTDLCGEVAAAMSTPNHAVEVRFAEHHRVVGDPSRLRSCIENLVANAIKHSPADATVVVDIAPEHNRDGAFVAIEISDAGPGIPSDVLPHIFDRFATGNARSGGVGLGLYLARRVAELHRGALDASSSPGQGARFVLKLPRHDDVEIDAFTPSTAPH